MSLGTIGIDIERKLVLLAEKDANIWKSPEIDKQEQEETKKYASKEHKVNVQKNTSLIISNERLLLVGVYSNSEKYLSLP